MTTAKPKLPGPTEAEILRSCLAILRAHGVFCWRQNTGAAAAEYNGKRRYIVFGMPGTSDILGILPGGKFLSVEVKRPGNKPTAAQEAFLDLVRSQGGAALWVDDTAKLMDWLKTEGLTNATR